MQPYNYNLQTSAADIANAPLQGLGQYQAVQAQKADADLRKAQLAEQARQRELQPKIAELTELALSGDDEAARQLFILNPEMAAKTDEFMGVRDEQSKAAVSDWFNGYMSIPEEQRRQYLIDNAELTPFTADDEMLAMGDEQLRAYEKIIAPKYLTAEQYKAITPEKMSPYQQEQANLAREKFNFDKSQAAKAGSGGSGTANIKDYEYYTKLKETDPEAAEQFANQAGITGGGKATAKMQDFEAWKAMPEGPDKEAFAQIAGIKPKDTAASLIKREETEEAKRIAAQGANQTISLIDDFVANDSHMSAMTGYRGRAPSLTQSGFDAEQAMMQIKNSLTLDNLDKMTGVLTDRDIEVLASAASAIKPGMSEPAMRKEFNRIKNVLKAKVTKGKVAEAAVDSPKVVQFGDLPE